MIHVFHCLKFLIKFQGSKHFPKWLITAEYRLITPPDLSIFFRTHTVEDYCQSCWFTAVMSDPEHLQGIGLVKMGKPHVWTYLCIPYQTRVRNFLTLFFFCGHFNCFRNFGYTLFNIFTDRAPQLLK